jgi:hypothetical protein
MGYFLAFPVLTIMIMLQMAIFSRLMLLHGTADLIMLSVAAWTLQERVQSGWFWALLATVFTAFGVMGVARLLQIRIWQTSILAMFIVTIVGTVIQHLISIIVLNVADWPIPFFESLAQVTLPSILFNLFLALPVYVLLNALARVVYPAIES